MKPQQDFPPGNFHLSDFVYRPGVPQQQQPGLLDKVESLHRQGRFRSALEPLLEILAESPRDQEALTLALIVVGEAKTNQVQANEALGPRQLLDRRLDPIFAQCSRCGSSWAAHSCLFSPNSQILNPIGIQCRSCGYVMCRKCYSGAKPSCLNCGSADVSAPVYPTGRTPRQMERRNSPVQVAIIMREGPLPPDREWLVNQLEMISPDVLEGKIRLNVHPLFPWPEDVGNLALALAARLIGDEQLDHINLAKSVGGEFLCPDGLHAYILKLY